ncbi:alpha/beta-hydrolase family protein [Gordonia otitidis]|uniref:alpha/beta hydrolase n=1 Tax=Gordonia otitidis TaxID=249058 RepID=UPI001D133932|nr:alpha/beta-hydrolase family protein [Gordonia otitidis]UEA61017.1 alpha/beta-hydrolase family protein [Gordonia otitidis]
MPDNSATGSEHDPSATDSAPDTAQTESGPGRHPGDTSTAHAEAAPPEAADTEAAGKKAAGTKAAGTKAAETKTAGEKTAETNTAGKQTADTNTADTNTAGEKSADADVAKPSKLRRAATAYAHRISFAGLVFGTVFLWLSTTPSLLPRGPLFQGVVSGGAAAVGYCLGVFIAWLIRYMLSRPQRWSSPKRNYWIALAVVSVIGTVVMLYWYSRWQTEIRNLMGVENLSWTAYPIIVVFAVLVCALLMVIGQAWASLVTWLVRQLNKIAPPRVAAVAGLLVVALLTVFILNGVVAKYSMKALNSSFATANDEVRPNTAPPTSGLRSGGPGSLVTWESLGREGRVIVSGGPDVTMLSDFNKQPAMEPIRSFVGLGSGDNLRANAQLAADELVRVGGLKRKVIAVGSTTGSGWLNKVTIDSLEYMYNGDVATVAMQYSYLPSWISFIVDKERARQAGAALFEAVDAKVRELPEAERPKLVVFGESLGSFGAEAAFGTVPTVTARTDGALLSGPTFSNTLWNDATAGRDRGSPQWLPIYNNGRQVRFIAEKKDLARPDAPWDFSRMVYLQHASDPIAWWSPELILREPDWLKEARGRDVIAATHWIPFVTFLQVSADMAVSVDVPDGHGHNYQSAIPYAWSRILQPPGWTDEKTEQLEPRLHRDG